MTYARLWLAGVLVLCGCKVELPKINVPALPQVDLVTLPLPKTPDGKYLLMQLSQAHLEIDPTVRDPLTAVGDCVDQITYCYEPKSRSLDECVRSVRTCSTSTPWTEPLGCCPKACQDGYQKAVDDGLEGKAAFDKVFFEQHDCFPGVADALEGR